jgi:hypothetical protein
MIDSFLHPIRRYRYSCVAKNHTFVPKAFEVDAVAEGVPYPTATAQPFATV